MSTVHKRCKKIAEYVAYTDGACKNNNRHDNAVPSKSIRSAGCGFVIFKKNEHIDAALTDICVMRKSSTNSLSHHRRQLANGLAPFVGSICCAVPLPTPVDLPHKVSNNRAELYAFNCVLSHFLASHEARLNSGISLSITIKTDSEYVLKVFSGARSWQHNRYKLQSGTVAKNVDYVKEMLKFVDALQMLGHTLTVLHVPAHQQEIDCDTNDTTKWIDWFGNDVADRLSNVATGIVDDINYTSLRPSKSRKRKRKK